MYLPLAGFDPDREKNRRKMSINSVGSAHHPAAVQPTSNADRPGTHTEKIEPVDIAAPDRRGTVGAESGDTDTVKNFYGPPGFSTQDFVVLRTRAHDDQFQALDDAIARLKENTEQAGEMIEALHKLGQAGDPDNLALQVLTKTLEAMEEATPKK